MTKSLKTAQYRLLEMVAEKPIKVNCSSCFPTPLAPRNSSTMLRTGWADWTGQRGGQQGFRSWLADEIHCLARKKKEGRDPRQKKLLSSRRTASTADTILGLHAHFFPVKIHPRVHPFPISAHGRRFSRRKKKVDAGDARIRFSGGAGGNAPDQRFFATAIPNGGAGRISNPLSLVVASSTTPMGRPAVKTFRQLSKRRWGPRRPKIEAR